MEISSSTTPMAYTRTLPLNLPEPVDCDGPIPDQVHLSPHAMQDPIPQTLTLPEAPFKPYKPQAEFRGQAPLPSKFDFHSYEAGPRVAHDAQRREKTPTRELTGKLWGFRDTTGMSATNYGTNNQCANFVSAFAQRLGLKGNYLVVPDLEKALIKQGWQRVSAAEARPGDVWMSDSHTELVTSTKHGLPRVTGSNNGGNDFQTISGHTQSSGRFYTRPLWRNQY